MKTKKLVSVTDMSLYVEFVISLSSDFVKIHTVMIQIVDILKNGTDDWESQCMIKNREAALSSFVQQRYAVTSSNSRAEWINKMRELGKSVDSSVIDMNDERTRYIMSR